MTKEKFKRAFFEVMEGLSNKTYDKNISTSFYRRI